MTDTHTEQLKLNYQQFELARHGDTENLRSQLVQDLSANACDEFGTNLLMLACAGGHYQTSQLLLEYGAEVNASSSEGKTPLMFAAMFNRKDVVDLLLDNGADAYAKSSDGLTALSLARAMGAEAAARRLAQHVELF